MAQKAKLPIIAALTIGGSAPAKTVYIKIPTSDTTTALLRETKLTKKSISSLAIIVTFIPEATITCKVPVKRSFSKKSPGKPRFIPSKIPASKELSGSGIIFLIIFSSSRLIVNKLFINPNPRPSSFCSFSIL